MIERSDTHCGTVDVALVTTKEINRCITVDEPIGFPACPSLSPGDARAVKYEWGSRSRRSGVGGKVCL
ncbi:MAG: hypothetical protein K0S45_2639 [Nitrospira sp.]|jgi:hypothetical protein|nr:hypothetical protein [Nitrospira sp.]